METNTMNPDQTAPAIKAAKFHKQMREQTTFFVDTVKPVLSGHSKIDKTKILLTNDSLMKVESIAECSKGSIRQ